MDQATFKADHPDLYSQVFDKGKAEAAAETDQKIRDAVSAETDRVLALAGAVLGEDAAKAFTGVVRSGATAEMAASLKAVFGQGSEPEDDQDPDAAADDADKSSRARILDGLKQAHADGVGQQTGRDKPSEKSVEDQAKAYADLVNDN